MKKFWHSRTFWAALLSFVATMMMGFFGIELPDYIVNFYWVIVMWVMRAITKEPIDWNI